jgi:hypothetical protein
LNFFNQAALKIKVLTAGVYLCDVEHPYPEDKGSIGSGMEIVNLEAD